MNKYTKALSEHFKAEATYYIYEDPRTGEIFKRPQP